MRWSNTLIPTLREDPKDTEAMSHKLLLRGGYVRKLSSGVYSYLPLGLKVLKKICSIIAEEMFRAGADEVSLPALHPAELWKKTGRYEALGEDKLAFKNRTGQEFVLGPTHEEVITELVGAYVKSHRDLPKILFQIQTKFRDELRPRFGVIRTKEFIMKDAYSFDKDEAGLDESYQKMFEAYKKIFTRCGLPFRIVGADSGLMGGRVSQEFMVECEFGEDIMIQCAACGYLASRDIAERARGVLNPAPGSGKAPEAFDTPNLRTVDEITSRFKLKPEHLIKTLIYMGDGKPVACLIRGDRELNEAKLRKLCGFKTLIPAKPEDIQSITGGPIGFSGPVGLQGVRVVADFDIEGMTDSVTGANQKDTHLRNVNIGRDFKPDLIGDLRHAAHGDLCPKCGKPLAEAHALELGHVFKLGTRYTDAFEMKYLDEKGEKKTVIMGCYGIGVNRILAAHIEGHHDAKGMVWSKTIAPYSVLLVTLNQSDLQSVRIADEIYEKLSAEGIEVLYDDRNERAGVKFNDGDLIGIPLQVIVSERNLKEGKLEVCKRLNKETSKIPPEELLGWIRKTLSEIP